MRFLIIKIIKLYQNLLSPDRGFLIKIGIKKPGVCVFYPTCSDYTIQSIEKYGIIKGLFMGLKRIIRCTPWQKKHIDPVK